MTEELAKAYDPKTVEDKWYSHWLKSGFFKANPSSKKKSYTIVIPPPNVTGILTMGHVLNNTIQDILARRKRMQGFEVLWLPGVDHAGIATQTVVERTLKSEGVIKHRDDLGREKFLERVWEWKHKHGGIIIQQLKKLGCSCDWDRTVFTMDGLDPAEPHPRINYSECVKRVFVDLYKKKLIYRGKKMVNWCPVSRTALSDEEVEMKEVDGQLWHFRYPLIDAKTGKPSSDFVVVATTRPETMLGDEAVAVNPKDKRYKKLVGRKVFLPLQNKPIPIIADPLVEMGFGTGAVKVTPAHDPADYEMALRHKLPLTVVIGSDGMMTSAAGEKFEGLDRFECREAVVVDMKEVGFVEKIEPYKHNVGYSERADVPVEPLLSEQWFLKYPSVQKALKTVANGEIKFWPDRWTKVYAHWMENIRDWCISRQLWWGHQIPAWHCHAGIGKWKMENRNWRQCPPIVSLDRPKKCPNCGGIDLQQDPDVLDTWFSSWLWPFATLGWPEKTPELKKFYPTSDLVTAPDIIFFWVARMIMAGYEFMGERPFDNVYFTGLIRDGEGRKMSKSLGNSPDPLDLITKYGADGLRFGLMLIAPKGQDILFSEERIEVGRNFMNKLWNASRFVMMNTADADGWRGGFPEDDPQIARRGTAATGPVGSIKMQTLSLADKWILNRLDHAVRGVNGALDHYQFDTAARTLYEFVWGEYCDWYLELAKTQLADPEHTESTRSVLIHVLKNILVLLHPYAPFITEEIWQKVGESENIVSAAYPTPPKKVSHEKEASDMQLIIGVTSAIRNIRGEHNIKPGQKIGAELFAKNKEVSGYLEKNKNYIMTLARIEGLSVHVGANTKKEGATAVAGGVEIFVPFAGLINIEEEKVRLTKESAKLEAHIARMKGKLGNNQFIKNAPKEIVEQERSRLRETENELKKLQGSLRNLG